VPPTDPTPPGLRTLLGFQFAKCGSWLERRLETALEPVGLRVRHFLVLAMLDAAGALSQQEMSGHLSLDPTLMVAVVDELERRELIVRARDPRDRRRYAVSITPAGREAVATARSIADAVGDEVFSPLTKAERRQLAELIGKVMGPYWSDRRASGGAGG